MIPSLILNRLVVIGEGKLAFDLRFQKGINIIRGDNGTGKSTIIDFIYYGLGAELTEWTDEQKRCSEVVIEVLINHRVFCLKREIKDSGTAPMYFYEGTSEYALNDSQNWLRYPIRRSDQIHSYSQQLFKMMGLPQHKTDDSKNLTMHQILRLMYIDQITQTNKLLKADPRYDNYNIRKAIGEFLLGIDDLVAHNLRQKLIKANKNHEIIKGELKAINRILTKETSVFRKQTLLNEISKAERAIAELEGQKHDVRNKQIDVLNREIKEKIATLNKEIHNLSQKKTNFLDRKDLLKYELVDTKLFLESVKFRLNTLEQSKLTNIEIGELSFRYCPACLSPLDENHNSEKCGLCKTELNSQERHYPYIQMANELTFQIKESNDLINRFEIEIEEIDGLLHQINKREVLLKSEYQELATNIDSVDAVIGEISTNIGFHKSQIIGLNEKMELADRIVHLQDTKDKSTLTISRLNDQLSLIALEFEDRERSVYSNICEIAVKLLQRDGGYEEAFKHPEYISFDFGHDRMSVNGRVKFSASSMVIMKNSIRLAIFINSINDVKSRIPRFLLFDNVEDKGMMPARSQTFQRAIVEIFEKIDVDFQLIFATSMVDPILSESDFVIGPYYKKGEHTLQF
ncbi:MAG: AAA family ATPase [Nitrosopumilus sp.]